MKAEAERNTDAEFGAVTEKLGISPGGCVDPHTGLVHAIGRRRCRSCASKERCREVLRLPGPRLSAFTPFCPNADVLMELLYYEPAAARVVLAIHVSP